MKYNLIKKFNNKNMEGFFYDTLLKIKNYHDTNTKKIINSKINENNISKAVEIHSKIVNLLRSASDKIENNLLKENILPERLIKTKDKALYFNYETLTFFISFNFTEIYKHNWQNKNDYERIFYIVYYNPIETKKSKLYLFKPYALNYFFYSLAGEKLYNSLIDKIKEISEHLEIVFTLDDIIPNEFIENVKNSMPISINIPVDKLLKVIEDKSKKGLTDIHYKISRKTDSIYDWLKETYVYYFKKNLLKNYITINFNKFQIDARPSVIFYNNYGSLFMKCINKISNTYIRERKRGDEHLILFDKEDIFLFNKEDIYNHLKKIQTNKKEIADYFIKVVNKEVNFYFSYDLQFLSTSSPNIKLLFFLDVDNKKDTVNVKFKMPTSLLFKDFKPDKRKKDDYNNSELIFNKTINVEDLKNNNICNILFNAEDSPKIALDIQEN